MSASNLFGALVVLGLGFAALRVLKRRRNNKILMVVTSHDKLGSTGKPTGFWLEELATPYFVLRDAGYQIVIASPKGGKPPIDPKSEEKDFLTASSKRFKADVEAKTALEATKKLSEVDEGDFAALFYPGGHGPLWDLAEDPNSFWLIERFAKAVKPIAAVCHGPAVFKKTPSIVKGMKVTGFTNEEEIEMKLDKVVPFLVEDMLKSHGANFSKAGPWQSYVVTDNNSLLITGQNPQSSEAVAKAIVKKLQFGGLF